MTTKRWTSRTARLTLTSATVALVVAWALLLRPQVLGGPAAYVIVSGHSMEPTLGSGDLVVARESGSYRVGDIVAYRIPKGDPGAGALVIHRITGGSARTGYVTRGDNRDGPDEWRPKPADVLGKRVVTVPHAGLLFTWVQRPLGLAIAAGLAAFLFVSAGSKRHRERWEESDDVYSLSGRFAVPENSRRRFCWPAR
jgi:signal peptidase I